MGPKAPKDPEKKEQSFYIMRGKQVSGNPQPDGSFTQFLYMNDGRMISGARIVGSITDEEMLKLLATCDGFRKVVKRIGVTVEAVNSEDVGSDVTFFFQMYGKEDQYGKGSTLRLDCKADGFEYVLNVEEHPWNGEEDIPGQIRFAFPKADMSATVAVRFYLHEGFTAPAPAEEKPVDVNSKEYASMIEKCILSEGNYHRLQKVIRKAQSGEKITIAGIGGSITQGAGAVPINTECYVRKFYEGFLKLTGAKESDVTYVKAGVGGTPSELGMIRYEVDVCDNGRITPDLVIAEFAVNDAGDETGGACYESLIKKILLSENQPAVIAMFAVFVDDWNLQDRLFPVANAYQVPSVSAKDAICWQFADPKTQIMTRNQFFYDRYHPTNLGHTIMADCMLYLVKQIMDRPEIEDMDITKVTPVIGDGFTTVRLFDRTHALGDAKVLAGSFDHTGGPKQLVERDMNLFGTPEFEDNWYYEGTDSRETFEPYQLTITCKKALLVAMDSADPMVGKAKILVDGKEARGYNPLEVGWVHANAVIILDEEESKEHQITVTMDEGDFDKSFSILGFGIVE